jgi:hypothetical protein
MDAGEGSVGCVGIGTDVITFEEFGGGGEERERFCGRRGHSRDRDGGSSESLGAAAQPMGSCLATGSHSAVKANLKLTYTIAQAGSELVAILLPQPPKSTEFTCVPPCLSSSFYLFCVCVSSVSNL